MSSVFYNSFAWLFAIARRISPWAWIFIWLYVIGTAVLVHLAFLTYWPDHFLHEDSAAYLDEALSILTGHYVDDPGRRPYGVAFFLVLLSKLFSPSILVFVIAQHILSIVSALLIAAAVRFAGAPRIFSVLAFLLASLYGRTVHYDNTVGAETISVFLMCVAMFIATGVAFRNWPPFPSAVGIGLSLGSVMVCRSASVGAAGFILLWLLLLMSSGWLRRFGVVLLAGGITVAVYFIPAGINLIVGKQPAGSEAVAVMAFVVGYSGDFDHGVHLDRKAQARALVNERRAAYGPAGFADGGEAQWPFQVTALLGKPNDTDDDIKAVVRDIFVETLTTPSTLWRHLSVNFAKEMYFLLFDGSVAAAQAASPQGFEFFVARDRFPLFKSPTGLQRFQLINDYYSPPHGLRWLLPSADQLQARLSRLMTYGYTPRYDPAPLCCRLQISSEYDKAPGPIRWLSASTLILLVLVIVGEAVARLGWLPRLPRNLVAGGVLMIVLALINAAFPTFLVYGLNRYAYCVTPFMAGASALLGAVLFEWLKLAAANWRRGDLPTLVPRASVSQL
jgi:hypothetical protein